MEQICRMGIDHGYGNIKTAHTSFITGITRYESEPTIQNGVIQFNDLYYKIGEEHKEFSTDKISDNDFYIMTLAAIARELNYRGRKNADLILAVGLPFKWVREQKAEFARYLSQNKKISFYYNGNHYLVGIVGIEVYPQGVAAAFKNAGNYRNIHIVADIGNGTMNIIYINNGKIIESKSNTEKMGVNECVKDIRPELVKQCGINVDESIIHSVLAEGTADIKQDVLQAIKKLVKGYTEKIMRALREYGYHPDLVTLHFAGGGALLMKNFAELGEERVEYITDIRANAIGYEAMSEAVARRRGNLV